MGEPFFTVNPDATDNTAYDWVVQSWLSLLSGMALAATLPPAPLGILAPLPLAWLLGRGGFGAGFLAGLGFWALHLVWLPLSFVALFETPWGAVPYLPLVLIKAALWGVVFGLSRGRPLRRAGLWVVQEYLTSLGEVAFPWGFMGYALVEAPGRILASLGGVYLLSLVVLGVAVGLQAAWRRLRADPVVFSFPTLGLLGLVIFWVGLWVMPLPTAQGNEQALLVQGNINPLRKLEGFSAEATYLQLTRQGLQAHPGVAVVVWPETAVSGFAPELEALLAGRELLSGLETGLTNRVVRVYQGQITHYYDKNRLVPFGEYFPWSEALHPVYGFFFRAFGFPQGLESRTPGQAYQPLGRYGAFICYESVFPSVTRRLVLAGAEVLELGSNDAWYGPSFGGLQHFQMGRLRAVETGRWLLRAGNDGVTAIIDPYGRVVARIPQRQAAYLVGAFAAQRHQTPYVRFGDWVVVLAGLLGIGLRNRAKGTIV